MQVGVQEPFGGLMLSDARGHAGFDVAVIGLGICAIIGEQAGCKLMPGAGGQLGCVWGTVCTERDWERDG